MTPPHPRKYRFSEAPIWDLQRTYFEEQGLQAWNNDQVPQYITSNPMIGAAYADMLFGFLQDLAARGDVSQPVTIVELGAGAGRLAFQTLHQLCELRAYAGLELPPLRYIMTDLAVKNVEGWRRHPALQRFVGEGLLDFAAFDAVRDSELRLAVSGETIRPGDLAQPLVIVANYFFDSIPQELIYVGDGRIFECDVQIELPDKSERLTPSAALERMKLVYSHRREPSYEQPSYPYRELIELYRQELEDSHVLLPLVGLACLERLERLSRSGFLLLTADKGDHRLDNWRFAEPPQLIHHGSFSLTANYHALQYVYERRGALGLFTAHHYKNINVGCLFRVEQPLAYAQTRLAYKRFIERFGPDDFFSLKEWVDRNVDGMGMQQLLAFWRLGGYDAEFFVHALRRLSTLLPEANDEERLDLKLGIEAMWASYYKLEQRYDLALDAGLLLFEMEAFAEAKRFLETSVEADEDDPVATVLQCLAICCYELGLLPEAERYLREALKQEPDHEEALALLKLLE